MPPFSRRNSGSGGGMSVTAGHAPAHSCVSAEARADRGDHLAVEEVDRLEGRVSGEVAPAEGAGEVVDARVLDERAGLLRDRGGRADEGETVRDELPEVGLRRLLHAELLPQPHEVRVVRREGAVGDLEG